MKERLQKTQKDKGQSNLWRLQDVYIKLKKSIGQTNINKVFKTLSEEMEGERITIPTKKALDREIRDSRIRQGYDDGLSRKDLARQYRLSLRSIDTILSNVSIFEGLE